MQAFSDWLIGFGVGDFVNAYDWVWPLGEILHFIGMALLIGTVGLLDARILGFAKGLPIASLERLVPYGVVGFAFNFVTGVIFVMGNPTGGPIAYLENLAFQIKMILILIAGINILIFYFTGISRAAEAVGANGEAALNAKLVAGTSLVIWFAVIVFGRLIMYNDTLLLFLGM